MIDWPDRLVVDIARRTCLLYIGSGVSANSISPSGSHPPTWEDFLRQAAARVSSTDSRLYIEQLLNEKDMLSACDVIIKQNGHVNFYELAVNCFRRPGFKHAEIHKTIYDLDARIVITPNVDKIYDQYATYVSQGTIVIKKYSDSDIFSCLRSQDRSIFKVHGSIDSPAEMIFSQYQYNSARYKYNTFYKMLDSLALTHTYLFIGCGIYDPDIRLTLENNNFLFPGCWPHYLISQKNIINGDLKHILKDNRNIEVLEYTNNDNKHSNLLLSLKELLQRVEEKRTMLADSQNW